jgi:hypothetical protein
MMRTNVVYENDEFDYTEEPPMLRHRPVRPGQDRGQLIAAYAVAVHRDGRQMQTVLHPDEVAKRKAVAKTKAVWDQWTPQMWAKSAGHDLFDDLPLDPADQRIRLVLDASDMAPGESAQMLYGPHGAAVAREVGPAPALSLPQGSSSGADDGQQAEGADPQPSASSAPGPTDFGGEAADDGDPALPAEDITEDDVRLAKLAAEHVVHVTNKDTYVEGLTLAQVHENSDYDPVVFFRWALGDQLEDGDLKTAAIAYAKVNLPFLHDELVGGQQ